MHSNDAASAIVRSTAAHNTTMTLKLLPLCSRLLMLPFPLLPPILARCSCLCVCCMMSLLICSDFVFFTLLISDLAMVSPEFACSDLLSRLHMCCMLLLAQHSD